MVGRKDLHDKQKLYKRLKRKNEFEEQRANRLEKRRNYGCFKRANESELGKGIMNGLKEQMKVNLKTHQNLQKEEITTV